MLNPYQTTKSFLTTTNRFDFPLPYEQDSFIKVQCNLDLQRDYLDEESCITIGILKSNASIRTTIIEQSSIDYNLLIESNLNRMKSNISLYISSSSNLSDLTNSNEALSNLGLDKFNLIDYRDNDNTLHSGQFSIQLGSSVLDDEVFFDFLSNDYDVWRENLPNIVCVTSNQGGITWGTIPQDGNEDVNISFTRAASNISGTVKININLTSNIDTIPTYSVYSEQVNMMNSNMNGILPEVTFEQFLSNNARVDPDSNLLHPSSNLFELFEIMKSNDDDNIEQNRIRRKKVYDNLELHPIAYLRNQDDFTQHLSRINLYIAGEPNDEKIDYSNLSNKPTALSCFNNDSLFVSKYKGFSEFIDSSHECKSNIGIGTIAQQNRTDVELYGSNLNMRFLDITNELTLQLNNEVFQEDYTILQASNDGSAYWADIYEYTHDAPDDAGIVHMLESTWFDFNDPEYIDLSTYTTKVLYNVHSNFQLSLSNINNEIYLIKTFLPSPKNFTISFDQSLDNETKALTFEWSASEQFYVKSVLSYIIVHSSDTGPTTTLNTTHRSEFLMSSNMSGEWSVYAFDTNDDSRISPHSVPFVINDMKLITEQDMHNSNEKSFIQKFEVSNFNRNFSVEVLSNLGDYISSDQVQTNRIGETNIIDLVLINLDPGSYEIDVNVSDDYYEKRTSNLELTIVQPVITFPNTYFTPCNLKYITPGDLTYLKILIEADVNGLNELLMLSNLQLFSNETFKIDTNEYQLSNEPGTSNYTLSFSVSNNLLEGTYTTNVGIIDDWGYTAYSNTTLQLDHNFDTFHIVFSNNRTAEIIPINGFSLSNHYNWFDTFYTSNIQLENKNYDNCNVEIVHYNSNGFKLVPNSNLEFTIKTPTMSLIHSTVHLQLTNDNKIVASNLNSFELYVLNPTSSNQFELSLYSNEELVDTKNVELSNISEFGSNEIVFDHVYLENNFKALYDDFEVYGKVIDNYGFSNEASNLQTFDTLYFSIQERNIKLDSTTKYDTNRSYIWNSGYASTSNLQLDNKDSNYTCSVVRSNEYDLGNT